MSNRYLLTVTVPPGVVVTDPDNLEKVIVAGVRGALVRHYPHGGYCTVRMELMAAGPSFAELAGPYVRPAPPDVPSDFSPEPGMLELLRRAWQSFLFPNKGRK